MNSSAMVMNVQVPDFAEMKLARTELQELVTRKVHGLSPVFQDSVQSLYTCVEQVDRAVRDKAIYWRGALKSLNVHTTLAEIETLRGLPAINAQRTEQEIRLIEQELQREGLLVRTSLVAQHAELATELQQLKARRTPDVRECERDVADERVQLSQSIEQWQQTESRLGAQKEELEAFIKAFKSPSLSDTFKNGIPSEEKIDAATRLATRQVDIDLLKLLAKVIKENIDLIFVGQKYAEVVDTHNRVQRQHDDAIKQLKELDRALSLKEREAAELAFVPQIEAAGQRWQAEVQKLSEGWSGLLLPVLGEPAFDQLCQGLIELTDYAEKVHAALKQASAP